MGLFEFLKNAGSKVFNREEAPAKVEKTPEMEAKEAEMFEKQKLFLLRNIVDNTGIEVDNLELDLNDDTVTIYGQVGSQSDKERLILAMGNVEGIAAVDDRIGVEVEEPAAEFYTVQKGDSLSKIAKQYYGDPMKYKELFAANQPLLSDPNKIYPGQQIRIPKEL